MTIRNPGVRQWLRNLARVGAGASATMLVVTAWSLRPAGAAATYAGTAQIVDPSSNQAVASGGSATNFTLKLPSGAACTGDSAHGQYKVQSYMVSTSVDPASLQFGSQGPQDPATNNSHAGPNLYEALFDTTGTPYVQAQTADATQAGGPGPIINVPAFNFEVYTPSGSTSIPPGAYYIGIACTLGVPSATQLDKFWVAQMTIAADPTDSGPAHVSWTVDTPTYAAPTTTAGTTTTTTPGGDQSTTTTTPGATTTTTGSDQSTTTTAVAAADPSNSSSGTGSSAGAVGGSGDAPSASTGSSSGSLPNTGGRLVSMLVWAGLLAIFGRMAVLFGRPLRVRREPAKESE